MPKRIESYESLKSKYDFIGYIINGFTRVKLNNKWGLININEEEVIPLIYDELWDVYDNLVRVKLNNKWGFINKNGEEAIPLIYEYAQGFIYNLCRVRLNNKYGFIDKKGKEVVPIIYDFIWTYFNGNLTRVNLNNSWGFLDIENLPTVNEFKNSIINIGSRGDTLYYQKYKDTYVLSTGCFIGDLEEFEKRVNSQDYQLYNPISYKDYIKVIEELKERKGSDR